MQITSLNLSGFKYFDVNTQINFKDKQNNLLSNRDSEQKYYIFEVILGVLFGLTSEEKINFRDLDGSTQTFTGMLTVEFSDRTILVERDFETDFVACLLSSHKEVKPFYQGKDFILNGAPRPYLDVLHEFFFTTEKDVILEICYDADANDPKTLLELLSTLYMLLSPQVKIADTASLVNPEKLDTGLLTPPDTRASAKEQIKFLKRKRTLLTDLLIIDSRIHEINYDLEQLQALIHLIQKKGEKNNSHIIELKRHYPDIYEENSLELRADILIWKSLKQRKIEKEIELENTKARMKQVNRLVQSDYAAYQKVPETFESDFDRFGKLKSELAEKRKEIYNFKEKLKALENKLRQKQNNKWFMLVLAPVVTFLISLFIFGPFWLLIIPETIIIILAVMLYFGHINETVRAEIFHANEDKRLTEMRIQEIDNEIKHIFYNNPLFKDEEYLIIHLDRFKKFSKYQSELFALKKKQTLLYDELQSEQLTKQLQKYEDKYSDKINIDRYDIEGYLDRFVEMQQNAQYHGQNNANYPGLETISSIKNKYLATLDELNSFRQKAVKLLNISNGETELEISNVSRKIRKLESKDQEQQFDPAKISEII